jgi:hypothetical protein
MTLPDLPPTSLQESAFTTIAGARILRGLPIPERA